MVMKNYRRTLPPLDYLLFFETVARHKNFTRAAEELNVSQAAVSKRIKFLETWLGVELISRHGRAVDLTKAGHKLAANASEALEYLALGIGQLRQGSHEKLSLASNIAVSQFWLTPQVNEYLLSQDAVPVSVTASNNEADILNQDHDAIVYYGSDIPLGWDGEVLFEEIWQPLAAPGLLAENPNLEQVPLLDFDKLALKWINWPDFMELTGAAKLAGGPRVNLGSYGSSLDAAIRGKGIALGCPDVLKYEIEAGRLTPLEGTPLKTGRTYFLIWQSGTLSQRTRDLLRDVGIEI
ncbi:transcriptional regulator, LysR family protein [Roseobacter sp. SK209-2-6]|uniref:LysR family transcriptional regulator n=1 Tax=Roseobacter sp. SK209-2-6 TaxID=388739 RepID=UPI0000F3F622|nr:LysR family transcriptional regulator [Roseobacter sp. SK209-2-6]EBA18030.1 transcriptional regulator, LysR family protein [Roseobacter sp. SK209-2-6]